MTTRTGHFAMSHAVTAALPSPMTPPTSLASGPVSTTASAQIVSRSDQQRGDADADGNRPPDRPALLDVPDVIGRAHERCDVARRRPQRTEQAHHEEHARGPLAALQIADRAGDDLLGRARCDPAEVVDERLRHGLAEQAQHGHEHEQHRKDRQDAEVRQGGGPIGDVVRAELAHGASDHAWPRAPRQLTDR